MVPGMKPSPPPYKAGLLVCCTEGHVIGRLARDADSGDPIAIDCIVWSDDLYAPGDSTTCKKCGASWFTGHGPRRMPNAGWLVVYRGSGEPVDGRVGITSGGE